jgi:CBS domain-containing protein
MTVRDVMTRPVISVRPEWPLKDVARLLVEHRISGVPVVDSDGAVLGVVSEADFLLKGQGASAAHRRPLARLFADDQATKERIAKAEASTAGEAMTAPAIMIEAGRPIPEAAAMMVDHRVNRLPVIDQGDLVGIVTRADLVRAYVRSDEQLLLAIREGVLRRTLGIDPDGVDIAVVDGVVGISGTVDRRSTAELIERVASMAPGVIAVKVAFEWTMDDAGPDAYRPDYVSPFTGRDEGTSP